MPTVGKLSGIEDALNFRLSQLVLVPVRRVAWPSISFIATIGELYLEPSFMPNRSQVAEIGLMRRHVGIYQIIVRGPINTDLAPLTEIADLIIEHFFDVTIVRNGLTVRVGSFDGGQSLPYRMSAFPNEGWRALPVTVPWYCDTFV